MNAAKLPLFLLLGSIVAGSLICAASIWQHGTTIDFFNPYLLFLPLSMAPLIVTLHRPDYRLGGAVIGFALLLSWIALTGASGLVPADTILVTVFVLLAMGIPAGLSLMCRHKPWAGVFWRVVVAAAVICGLASLLAIWAQPDRGRPYLLISSFMVAMYAGIAAILLINVGRGDRRYFRWPAILATAVAATLQVMPLWRDSPSPILDNTGAVLACGAITCAFINLLLMTRHGGLVRIWQRIAIVCALLTAAMYLCLLVVSSSGGMWALKALTSGLALTSGAALCMLVARTIARLDQPPRATV